MTRPSSVRAKAREIYCHSASQKPVPSPEPDLTTPSLTEKVRALYEHSAVPVREIARLAGVTERTIYKYVRKRHWTRRHRVAAVRGAGARFIRREEHNQPVALGLKATDPAGAARASAACCEAELVASAAQAEAQRQRRAEARILAMEATSCALGELTKYLAGRDEPAPGNDRIESLYRRILEIALSQWEKLAEEEKASASV